MSHPHPNRYTERHLQAARKTSAKVGQAMDLLNQALLSCPDGPAGEAIAAAYRLARRALLTLIEHEELMEQQG